VVRESGLRMERGRAVCGAKGGRRPVPHGRRGVGGRRPARLLALAAVAGLLALPTGAVAQPAAAEAPSATELGTAATIGYGRGPNAQAWTLVEVISSPNVPIAGRLEVRAFGPTGRAAASRDLEVAAGATKVLHLLVPPADQVQVLFMPSGGGGGVELPTGGSGNRASVLVGGFGEAPALPDPLSTAGTDRPVRGVAVDPGVLELGHRGFEALDALLVDASTLGGLPADGVAALETAVVAGLDLVVAVAPGDPALPLRWDPVGSVAAAGAVPAITPSEGAWPLTLEDLGLEATGGEQVVAAAVNAGRGRVVAVGAGELLGRGGGGALWRALLQPRPELARELGGGDDGELGARLFGGTSSLPGAAGAALFLLAFVVLVGPVNALVVRRLGRRELSWVTVPVIALLFTGVAAATTVGGGDTPSPVLRAAWWLDGVGQEVTAVAVQSPGRGVQQVTFPGARDAVIHQPWGMVVGTTQRVEDATVLAARLEALQGATAIGWGRPAVEAPLDVSAVVTPDGTVTVEVTNTSRTGLDDVAVQLATYRKEVGSLAAGASTTVDLDDLGDTLPAARFAGQRMFGGPPRVPVELGPAAAGRLLAWSALDGSPGALWVTGHTREDLGLARPQVAGGADDRGTFVAVGVTPGASAGAAGIAPHLVRRDVLRSDHEWLPWRPEPLTIEGQEEVVLRFRLPGPTAVGPLVSTLDRGGAFDQGMMDDPWGDGCFEVTDLDEFGEPVGVPEERCGADVACPPGAMECGGDDRRVEACFEDGRCQTAERIGGGQAEEAAFAEGFEVYDHGTDGWVPADRAFARDADTSSVRSPLGEVLVRARQVGWFEFAQRGLGVAAGDAEVTAAGGDP
jgi:hypothetical protein